MHLPIDPPVSPMLAKLTRELPRDGYLYEPKWDGFRCLVFRDGDEVELWSRQERPLGRYFPELVAGFRDLSATRLVLDGEIMLLGRSGFDFATLMSRLHPSATRVQRLAEENPASYVAFDLVADGDEDLRDRPFEDRRARLERVLHDARPPIFVTPATPDVHLAQRWYESFQGAGVDGVVAKHRSLRYEPGRRTMIKVKHERTADCVLAGFRFLEGLRAVSSLILALYDHENRLRHVGVVTQMPAADRVALVDELAPLVIPLEQHPWRDGFVISRSPLGRLKGSAARWTPDMDHDWVPLRPDRVVEVAFDQVDVDRFRHPARFRRWRPDRDAETCHIDQIEVDPGALMQVLAVEPANRG